MTTQVRPPRPEGSARGARRFAPAPTQERRESRAKGVLSALLLLLVVVGVPVALVLLDGVPGLPTSLPTREQLTQQIGVEQLVTVLLWVVWLAWLQFTVCVVVELVSGLRGVGLPQRVPLAGPSQRAARVLVASVLVLLGAAVPATAAVPAASGMAAASQVQVVAPAEVGAEQAATQQEAPAEDEATQAVEGERTYHLGDVPLTAEEAHGLVGKRVLVVQPPEGRYHDNLWDIAQRHLGDGRRYQEVFELNKGRDQPDGRELTLARLIQPGWLMVMPEDAAGVDRVTVEVAPVETPAAPVEAPPAEQEADAAGGADAGGAAQVATAVQDDVRSLVGAGLLAAGLLASLELVRRRRRTGEPSDPAV
ncbi:LysM peptidoglycan-binding domain-containing protein, partial [Cellulomonas massiliensis]|uniref:LysM peptidoglycan-binding domain-containing protein n=1 Tax=Cellulomonas massiliensis TaxID=1465811 RepID=UPI00352387FC